MEVVTGSEIDYLPDDFSVSIGLVAESTMGIEVDVFSKSSSPTLDSPSEDGIFEFMSPSDEGMLKSISSGEKS